MATERSAGKPAAKTPTRRKTTKRGPTKPAALKKLGLTQEDLDTLAAVKQAREDAAKNPVSSEINFVTTPPGEYTSYNEESDTAKSAQSETAGPSGVTDQGPQTWYVRNRINVEQNLRLERQTKKKRIELKPRGQRGDLEKIQNDDLEDSILLANLNLGTIEVITAAEAKKIIEKQTTNQQQAVHPAMAILRNELGEEYAPENIKVEPEFNSQGVTVARLKPVGGEFGEIAFDRANRGSFTREPGVAPTTQTNASQVGNPHIISDGFGRNDSAAQADAVARRKDIQGPEAGLGGITTVVVEAPKGS